ncbi:MAG: hypothetical protein IJJ33_09555 [Victivallales bacterium]|nr:hypothetical protein [Victivallales bacterium]
MLKHFRKLLLFVGLLTVGILYAEGVVFTYDLTVENASGKSLVFARTAAASDAVDDLDDPWPPNTPGGGAGINYCYFLAGGDDSGVGELLTVLAKDYRSSATKASTWTLVVETMAGSNFTRNWEAEEDLALDSS